MLFLNLFQVDGLLAPTCHLDSVPFFFHCQDWLLSNVLREQDLKEIQHKIKLSKRKNKVRVTVENSDSDV